MLWRTVSMSHDVQSQKFVCHLAALLAGFFKKAHVFMSYYV